MFYGIALTSPFLRGFGRKTAVACSWHAPGAHHPQHLGSRMPSNRPLSCHALLLFQESGIMVSLKLQKRLAASVLKCGLRKVWLDPNEVNEISMANSRKLRALCGSAGSPAARPGSQHWGAAPSQPGTLAAAMCVAAFVFEQLEYSSAAWRWHGWRGWAAQAAVGDGGRQRPPAAAQLAPQQLR